MRRVRRGEFVVPATQWWQPPGVVIALSLVIAGAVILFGYSMSGEVQGGDEMGHAK